MAGCSKKFKKKLKNIVHLAFKEISLLIFVCEKFALVGRPSGDSPIYKTKDMIKVNPPL